MKCCRCDCDQEGTIHLPGSEYYYCEPHSHCPHCGGSVANFVPYKYHGTIEVNIFVCPCVRRHGIKVHNEVIALRAKRADEEAAEAKANKKRGKTA